MTLVQAMQMAEQGSPKLSAGHSRLQGMAHGVERAGSLPDPVLSLGIANLPVSGEMAWRSQADAMTMRTIGVMQEFPNGTKRKLRTEISAAQLEVERINQLNETLDVRREAARAWLDVRHAQDRLAVLERLLQTTRLESRLLPAALAGGSQSAADSYGVRAAVELTQDRIEQQQSQLYKARQQLARYIGEAEAQRTLSAPPERLRLPHDPEQLLASIEAHPRLQVWQARERVSELGIALSGAGKKPDMAVELMLGVRPQQYGNMLGVQFKFGLPIFQARRQNLDVAAADKDTRRAHEETEEARRAYLAQLRTDLNDWQTASTRTERYRTSLLPLARERLQAAEAAYRGGRTPLNTALEARRALAETELAWHDAQLERDRLWVSFETLLETRA